VKGLAAGLLPRRINRFRRSKFAHRRAVRGFTSQQYRPPHPTTRGNGHFGEPAQLVADFAKMCAQWLAQQKLGHIGHNASIPSVPPEAIDMGMSEGLVTNRATAVANAENIARLKQGVDAWNAWRRDRLLGSERFTKTNGQEVPGGDMGDPLLRWLTSGSKTALES
jgi:hypothetical protein